MDAPNTRRIVLFGKTGAGKSSLANTIFGEKLFFINHTLNSESTKCQVKTKSINGRRITLIDSPGFFDPGRSEEDLKSDILKCVTECAPGPHAFLIVLKVEKFTEHEKSVITQMCKHFSEDALKYATVVFTHGDQLPEGMKIEEYVDESEGLSDLVKRCGGRCHIVDNKYWKNNQEDEYRSNKFQVAELLKTTEKIVMENKGGFYTNETLKTVESAIQKEEEGIKQSTGNMSQEETREQARSNILKKGIDKAPRTWIRYFASGAVIAGLLAIVSAVLIKSKFVKVIPEAPPVLPTVITVVEEDPITFVRPIPNVIKVVLEVPEVPPPQNPFDAIWNWVTKLFERTYDPWDLFK